MKLLASESAEPAAMTSPASSLQRAGASFLDLNYSFDVRLLFAILLYVEETGNRRCRLHCLVGSHEPAAAC